MSIFKLKRRKPQNTFVGLLDKLHIKYTQSFSNKYFNEHPHKNNLFGFSEMLTGYGIQNAGVRITDKENNIFNIETPFIAHTGGDFVAVYKIEPDKVHFFRDGKKISIPVPEFIQTWSGATLLAETTPESGEPDYKEHRKKELADVIQQSILALAVILIAGIAFFTHSLFTHPAISPLLVVNLIGVYISYILVLKQMHINSQYADKICSLFSKSDCNNVLESEAAKLWGIFGWSEIGLGYFSANVLILLFLPHLIPFLSLLNLFTLPYTFWSVWYQKTKARQWCPLCLMVLCLLWSIFILCCLFGYIRMPALDWNSLWDLAFTGSLYIIPVVTLNLLLPKLSEGNQVEQLRQEINSIKANEELFNTLLTQQPYYEVSESDSHIVFGNPDAQLRISILTNPFCNPCSKMHKRVENLLKETKENICVQYIFSSFNESLEYANKYLIAVYLEKDRATAIQLYTDWFEKGKELKESFFDGLQLDMTDPEIEDEFQRHESWKEKTKLRSTPTIIVNGYKLPGNYKIEDLRHFTEFNVNVK
ncbi:thioredoxin domain-containing protein [Parabacteroides sp. OttesenSCG-928-G21]|nr:thioredoxin domain-containing protein [Parabacteroides sp. OttesenSCG-928-G21]